METNINKLYINTKDVMIRVTAFVAFIGLWEILALLGVLNPFFTSQPSRVFQDLYEFYKSGDLVRHTSITVKASLWGLLIGSILGIIVGFILGLSNILAKIFEPIIIGFYGIPKLALAPIFVLWFGLGIESKIIMASLLVFFLVFFNTYGGIKDADRNIITSVRLMGASKTQIIIKVIMPSCIPWILAGIRGGLGASIIGAIVGEYMGASAGLGWMISYSTSFFLVDRVMACILILFFIGVIFNMILKYVERILLKWRPPTNYEETF